MFLKSSKGVTKKNPHRVDLEGVRAGLQYNVRMRNPWMVQEGPEDWSAKLRPAQTSRITDTVNTRELVNHIRALDNELRMLDGYEMPGSQEKEIDHDQLYEDGFYEHVRKESLRRKTAVSRTYNYDPEFGKRQSTRRETRTTKTLPTEQEQAARPTKTNVGDFRSSVPAAALVGADHKVSAAALADTLTQHPAVEKMLNSSNSANDNFIDLALAEDGSSSTSRKALVFSERETAFPRATASKVLHPAPPPAEIQTQVATNKLFRKTLSFEGENCFNKSPLLAPSPAVPPRPPAAATPITTTGAQQRPHSPNINTRPPAEQTQMGLNNYATPAPRTAPPTAPPPNTTAPPAAAAAASQPPAPITTAAAVVDGGGTGDPLRDHFMAFFESDEVMKVLESFANFKYHCEQRLKQKNVDPRSFDTSVAMLAAAADLSGLSFRMKKVINDLVPVMKKRKASKGLKDPNMKIVVSGAGPVGLHTALDIYMLGFANVTVVEKRNSFSRHNILTMWPCTAEHVQVVYNCREFFPLFSHRDKLPHLGTRELQLTLLKCGLLVGVKYLYNWETIGLEAPPVSGTTNGGTWTVGLKKPQGRVEPTGVLDLKAGKFEDAKARAADGACGMIEVNTFDPTFAVSNGKLAASNPDLTIGADVLVLAEGETSANSKKLGFTKKIQKFSRAIAIVLNLWRDAKNKAENKVQDFTVQGAFNSPAATALKAAGIDFEFMEYLRGTTHYVAICVMKKTLLSKKVCKEDIGGKDFIGRNNVSEENLFKLGREIVTAIGLPTTVPFCDFHGAKLFDFGSRSSLPLPFRLLGESTATPGKILSMDYSAEPRLAFVETNFLEKTIAWLDRTVLERRHGLRFVSDTQKARETTTIEKFEAERMELKEQLNSFNTDLAMVKREKPNPKKLLPIFPVGDALMEPFWPQGTGINRGFHTGMDASFCILQYNMDQDLSQALLSADFCYRQKSCLLLGPELSQKVDEWNSRPWSRYLNLAGKLQSYTMTDQELAAVKPAAIDLDQKTRLQCIENPWPVIPNFVGKPGPLQKFVLTAITPEEDKEKIQVAFKEALYIPRPIKAFGRSCCPKVIEKKVTKKDLKADAKNAMKEAR
ncbi:unnamed protein product [Amoebophrya sp. A120]|nr:unnamed protein product [Amoebophrya sp. A120]|eukprot:GSA120T00019521001.1